MSVFQSLPNVTNCRWTFHPTIFRWHFYKLLGSDLFIELLLHFLCWFSHDIEWTMIFIVLFSLFREQLGDRLSSLFFLPRLPVLLTCHQIIDDICPWWVRFRLISKQVNKTFISTLSIIVICVFLKVLRCLHVMFARDYP